MNEGIVMLAGPGTSANITYHAVAQEFHLQRVIRENRVGSGALLGRRLKKLGPFAVAGQVLFRTLTVPWLEWRSSARIDEIKRDGRLDESEIPPSAITRVASVNDDACIEQLRQIAPKVVVIAGTRIISERTLRSISAPFINLHAGITPLYRGVHGAYWALVEGRREACGVTAHVVDVGIDTGGILGQATIEPTPRDNFVTYRYLQIAAGIPLLKEAMRSALAGKLNFLPEPSGESKLWSHPTIFQYVRYRFARGVR